jgi:hypothetical protein
MEMPIRGATHYRARSIAVALVVGGHVVLLALLATQRGDESDLPDGERMTLVFVDPLGDAGLRRPTNRPVATARPVHGPVESTAPTPAPASESAAITPDIDWYANGSEAAQRAAAEPRTRDFGFPKREPAPREKKAFHWDKVHTERVHALEGGGIGIRLSENCELMLVPLPLGGCAFGKRKAHGDLFDEMKAPVEAGDWK